MSTTQQPPYHHADGSNCWTKNCRRRLGMPTSPFDIDFTQPATWGTKIIEKFDELKNQIAKELDREYGSANLRVKTIRTKWDGQKQELRWVALIYHNDEIIGDIERVILPFQHKAIYVLLGISNSQFRRTGFSKAFLTSFENWLREIGITEVFAKAKSTSSGNNGAYVWAAKNEYTWSEFPAKIHKKVQEMLRITEPNTKDYKALTKMDNVLSNFTTLDSLPSPQDFALTKGDNGDLGERLLSGDIYWNAKKTL